MTRREVQSTARAFRETVVDLFPERGKVLTHRWEWHVAFWLLAAMGVSAQIPDPPQPADVPVTNVVRLDGQGSTRAPSTNWNVGIMLGNGLGINGMGSHEAHDLALATIHAGKFLPWADDLFHASPHHFELAGEFWSGTQYRPRTAYLAGLTPLLRYHFRPGSRWAPFGDAGAGMAITDIGQPDLSTRFEFNLQAGLGCHCRLWDNLALTLETRFLHLSNAGIDRPNNGVNAVIFSGGLTWFF